MREHLQIVLNGVRRAQLILRTKTLDPNDPLVRKDLHDARRIIVELETLIERLDTEIAATAANERRRFALQR